MNDPFEKLFNPHQQSQVSDGFTSTLSEKYSRRRFKRLIRVIRVAAMIAISLSALVLWKTSQKSEIPPLQQNIYQELSSHQIKVNAEMPKEYFAILYSSSYCKSCVELLNKLDQMHNSSLNNKKVEMLFIDTHKRNTKSPNTTTSIHCLEWQKIKNKPFFQKFKQGHGPSLVIIDKHGNIITQHEKEKTKNNFKKIINDLDVILKKS